MLCAYSQFLRSYYSKEAEGFTGDFRVLAWLSCDCFFLPTAYFLPAIRTG